MVISFNIDRDHHHRARRLTDDVRISSALEGPTQRHTTEATSGVIAGCWHRPIGCEGAPKALLLCELARNGGINRTGPYGHFEKKEPPIASIAVQYVVGLQVHDRLEFLGLDRKALEALVEQTVHDALAAVRAPAKVVATARKRTK